MLARRSFFAHTVASPEPATLTRAVSAAIRPRSTLPEPPIDTARSRTEPPSARRSPLPATLAETVSASRRAIWILPDPPRSTSRRLPRNTSASIVPEPPSDRRSIWRAVTTILRLRVRRFRLRLAGRMRSTPSSTRVSISDCRLSSVSTVTLSTLPLRSSSRPGTPIAMPLKPSTFLAWRVTLPLPSTCSPPNGQAMAVVGAAAQASAAASIIARRAGTVYVDEVMTGSLMVGVNGCIVAGMAPAAEPFATDCTLRGVSCNCRVRTAVSNRSDANSPDALK